MLSAPSTLVRLTWSHSLITWKGDGQKKNPGLDSRVSSLWLRQGHTWHNRMWPPAPEFGTKEPIKQDDFPMISGSEEIPGCRLRIKGLQTLWSKGHCGAREAIDPSESLRSVRQSNECYVHETRRGRVLSLQTIRHVSFYFC